MAVLVENWTEADLCKKVICERGKYRLCSVPSFLWWYHPLCVFKCCPSASVIPSSLSAAQPCISDCLSGISWEMVNTELLFVSRVINSFWFPKALSVLTLKASRCKKPLNPGKPRWLVILFIVFKITSLPPRIPQNHPSSGSISIFKSHSWFLSFWIHQCVMCLNHNWSVCMPCLSPSPSPLIPPYCKPFASRAGSGHGKRPWHPETASRCSYQGLQAFLQCGANCLSEPMSPPPAPRRPSSHTASLYLGRAEFVQILGSCSLFFHLPGMPFICIADSFLTFISSYFKWLHR